MCDLMELICITSHDMLEWCKSNRVSPNEVAKSRLFVLAKWGSMDNFSQLFIVPFCFFQYGWADSATYRLLQMNWIRKIKICCITFFSVMLAIVKLKPGFYWSDHGYGWRRKVVTCILNVSFTIALSVVV